MLIDTGPLIALFDPKDRSHKRCREALKRANESLYTTVPVLTEAFHLLDPGSRGSDTLRGFVSQKGVAVWHLNDASLRRAFALMEKYRDHPMDLADASMIVAAEALGTRRVFTLDRRDFGSYRIKRGHRSYPVEILP
jgi:predicted nucleic acid-binding protein